MPKRTFVLQSGADPSPHLCVEEGPSGDGVGRWVPDFKHVLLAKLIGGTCKARVKWPHRVFVDPFCGPGRIRVKGQTTTLDGGTVVAWRQSQATPPPFTSMLVGDLAPQRAQACVERLLALGAPATAFDGEAASTVPRMIEAIPKGALVLAYLDPYNLQYLSFEIIRALAGLPKIDIAVHFSTMDLQRNVDMELDDARARFDDAAPGWRTNIPVSTLSKTALRLAFFAYWMGLVRGLGFEVSKEMPLARGDRGEPLYRLVFFSRHPLPNRIWGDVARGDNLAFDF